MKKITFLFAFFLSLLGGTQAWADAVTENFESASVTDGGLSLTTSNGKWNVVGSGSYVGIATDNSKDIQYKTGYAGHNESQSAVGNGSYASSSWIISPVQVTGSVIYWVKKGSNNMSLSIRKATWNAETSTYDIAASNLQTASFSGSSWTQNTIDVGETPTYIAFQISKSWLDDVTYTPYQATSGPGFAVKDGSTKLTSPYVYDFGLATAGTTKVFTLSNPGTEATPITVDVTGANGFTAVVEDNAATIPAGEEKTLTITMPNATASGSIVVTPTGKGLSAFTFNVSGTVRDPEKYYETLGSGSIPEDWSQTSWTFSAGYASTSSWYQSSNARLITPKLDIKSGEKIIFETIGTYPSDASYQTMVVEYSTDKTSWTASETAITLTSEWQTIEISDIPVGTYYIAIHASQAQVRNYYGGELPKVAKMVVTQPASLDFGLLDKDATPATKTFTIANTGRATLNEISVTSANDAFTVTGAPTSLAAGASQEVTITMATGTTGALSSLITVSATGMEDATFTVSGIVMPAGAFVVDFNDNALPSGWSAPSWSFASGFAGTTGYSAIYMTTPKLTFADTDYFVFKVKASDSGSGDYVTVEGSTDVGTSWSELASFTYNNGDFGNVDADYTTVVVSGIPSTVNMIRFKGYYVRIDDITGLTYAPVLSVTKDAAAVTTPAAYDFGECGANASVTYNFANAGAGTINITKVAISGDGAAAYSTNWTESVAAPFDLVITRAYDAARGGAAQEAVVTVTTSEGEFVINVTGTDLAADAPTMGVTLGGAAVATGAAADFGTKLKAAPAAKTYTITNTGTGTLTGTIATSDDSQFTVSKTSFTLAASESTTFDLALVFDTSYGDKAATITIRPTVAGLENVVINATASTMDPETWEEDFEGGSLPTGWTQGTWTIGTNNDYENKTTMALAPSSGTAGTIVTPCLTAKAGDVLTWDGYFNWYDEAMTVEYSNDNQETWTKIYDAYKAQSEFGDTRYTHKEMSFTAPADGDYYLRFTSTWRNGVDNFCGFKLNLPDHIMSITTSSIPSSMKIGQSFDATITVKESRGVDEAFTAKLFMGDEVIGTANGTVEAGASKTITITATPTSFGTKMMHFEVEYAGGTLVTANVSRTVADLNRLTLDETSASESLATGTYDVVTLKRTFVAGWNTVCLPNAVTDIEAFFGTGAKAYNFDSYEEGVLGFAKTTSMEASYPYIVWVPAAITDNFVLNDFEITYSNRTPGSRYKGTSPNFVYFYGTYARMVAGTMEGKWGVTTEAKIAKGTADASMNGFRGYFTLPDGASARLAFTDEDGTTTVINALELNQNVEGVYNLQGQKVERMQKGLYIVNGRKVVRK